MQLELRDDLLWLDSLTIFYKGNSITIPAILVDTGSASTLLDSDFLEQIGATASANDLIRTVYGIGEGEEFVVEKVVTLQIDKIIVEDFLVQSGAFNYGFEIHGILGLDFLVTTGAILDLRTLNLTF